MSGKTRTTDADVIAMNEVYRIAEEKTEAKYHEKIKEAKAYLAYGVLKATYGTKIKGERMREHFSRLLRVMFLRDAKEKLKQDGLWTQFCQEEGLDIRNADYEISKLGDFKDELLLSFGAHCGYEINNIKYLTNGDSQKLGVEVQNGEVYCNGQQVNLSPEEVQFVIDKLQDENRLQKEDHEAQKKAFDRVQEDSHKTITKMEKELDKFKREAERRGIPAEDDAFLKLMERARVSLDGALMYLDPDNIREELGDTEPTSRMTAAYLSTLDYARKQILAAFDTAQDMFGNPVMSPEEAWRPGIKLPDDFVLEAGK
jgi:hypothetical protein